MDRESDPMSEREVGAGSAQPADGKAHAYARHRGAGGPLYGSVRTLALIVLRLWFRLRVDGADHIPTEGAAIIAPNHKNFLDAFFIALATRRHVRYMAKAELFKGPLSWLLLRLGAFPVRRGQADGASFETARAAWWSCFPRAPGCSSRTRWVRRIMAPGGSRCRPALRSSRLRSPVPRIYGAAPCPESGACRSRSYPRSHRRLCLKRPTQCWS